jgi:hypothetical protein
MMVASSVTIGMSVGLTWWKSHHECQKQKTLR